MIRRQFLKSTGLVSLTPLVPGFVNRLAASTKPETDRSILVVLELSGGNDGINTLVPFRDEKYRELRPQLALDPDTLHKINDSMGLHRSLQGCKELFDDGTLSIVNGVGYPNPNRSHFESMGIWHRGIREGKRESGAGWLGHALDLARQKGQTDMDGYFVGRDAVAEAMIGRRAQVAALSRFGDLQLSESIESIASANQQDDVTAFVQQQMSDSYATARQMESAAQETTASGGYRNSRLGQQMRLVSRLIKTGSAARVYYTRQGGYDTHAQQTNTHSQLLFELSSSLKTFTDDMNASGLGDRVVVMAFSEFGRRVHENGSAGTDHGTAGPVFLAGNTVNGGLSGETTSLTDLEEGDLKTQFDFRRIYATLLDRWLEIDSSKVLGKSFEHLPIIG